MYISAVAIDFGSTNSGAARIDTIKDGKLVYSTPRFRHSDGYYAKDPTWFWISPDLMSKASLNYRALKDSDFRILSRSFRSTDDPNIVWGSDFLENANSKGYIETLESKGWIEFKRFKMLIYQDKPCVYKGKQYPIDLIVKLFFRILKIECLAEESSEINRNVGADEVQWAITIPSIWSSDNKRMMTNIAMEVFGNHIRILSEPEGPVVSERIHAGSGKLQLNAGSRSLVIDMGGGTTDICLLEDNEEDSDTKFKQLASCDGVGAGGNLIDVDFIKYMVSFFSNGLNSENGTAYDNLSEAERIGLLYESFIERSVCRLKMEKAWQLFKHGISSEYQIPREYIKWLDKNGHHEVALRMKEFMSGDIEFASAELKEKVYKPTFEKIYSCVRGFVSENKVLLMSSSNPVKIVFAGGLSLMQELRDGVISEIEKILGRKLSYNIANTSLMASGSIMDGAAYILLYRKSISRIAPYNIYDPYSGISYLGLREYYKRFGCEIKLGELNEMSEKDISYNNAKGPNIIGVPMAIKGKPFQDYKNDFTAGNQEQENIRLEFFGADTLIIHPMNNKLCWELGGTEIPNKSGDSFELVVDFNESENSGNLHYYVLNKTTGATWEDNIILKERLDNGN